MASRGWAEYLAEAEEHLRASRQAVVAGVAIPPAPPSPTTPFPGELAGRAAVLGAGYDQLAREVEHRMGEIVRSRPSPYVPGRPDARFVDRHA
jgi:hypothetical protein